MSVSFERNTKDFRGCVFSTIDQQMAAHIDDVNDYEKEACIPTFLRKALHRLEQFRAAFLNCRGTGCFNSSNGELCVFDGEFFEVEGEQVLRTAICDLGGSRRKYSWPYPSISSPV